MKTLVTGGAGFIGSSVVRAAIAQGHEIVNLDILTYAANLENLKSVEEHCPCPLKLYHLLLSNFDGKGLDYGKEEIFG